jgi:hypothetical protein
VCGNSACTDLGGGRSAMTVPTALHSEFFRFLTQTGNAAQDQFDSNNGLLQPMT